MLRKEIIKRYIETDAIQHVIGHNGSILMREVLRTFLFLLIPYVGIWLAALLPILLSLITLSPSHAIAVIAWVATVQFIEANFVTPMIIGSKVSMNPMVAMIALLLGETIWGIQGLILALPLVAMLKVIFDFVPTLNAYGFLLGAAPKRNKH